MNIEELLRDVFDRFILQNRMEKRVRVGILNLPEVLGTWKEHKDIAELLQQVKSVFNRLSKLSLAEAYAGIGAYKAAIRCLEKHIVWVRDAQKQSPSATLLEAVLL